VIVPRGVEDLVEPMQFARVHGMQWWDQIKVQGLQITMTPASTGSAGMFRGHAPGLRRLLPQRWRPEHLPLGRHGLLRRIQTRSGAHLKPDVALLPIGAYFPDTNRTVHTSPEEAVRGFVECGAKWMVPNALRNLPAGPRANGGASSEVSGRGRTVGDSQSGKGSGEGATMRLSPKGDIV